MSGKRKSGKEWERSGKGVERMGKEWEKSGERVGKSGKRKSGKEERKWPGKVATTTTTNEQ